MLIVPEWRAYCQERSTFNICSLFRRSELSFQFGMLISSARLICTGLLSWIKLETTCISQAAVGRKGISIQTTEALGFNWNKASLFGREGVGGFKILDSQICWEAASESSAHWCTVHISANRYSLEHIASSTMSTHGSQDNLRMTFLIRDEAAEGFVTVKEMSFWWYHIVGGWLPWMKVNTMIYRSHGVPVKDALWTRMCASCESWR